MAGRVNRLFAVLDVSMREREMLVNRRLDQLFSSDLLTTSPACGIGTLKVSVCRIVLLDEKGTAFRTELRCRCLAARLPVNLLEGHLATLPFAFVKAAHFKHRLPRITQCLARVFARQAK